MTSLGVRRDRPHRFFPADSIDASRLLAVLLVRAPFLFGWQKSDRGGPSRLMPELLHHLGKEVRGNFERTFWCTGAKRRPPDPPISILMGRTVAWVMQSIRALAGTHVEANKKKRVLGGAIN